MRSSCPDPDSLLGGFIFYNTNVLNRYTTAAERVERRAEYELRCGHLAGVPQPLVTGTHLRIEVHPERRAVEILRPPSRRVRGAVLRAAALTRPVRST